MNDFNEKKMFTYLRGYLMGRGMKESLEALGYAREKHDGQFRKDGQPYIVHPLSMACYAVALNINEDSIIATILLHDVCEDTNTPIEALPFSDKVKQGVKYMTFSKFEGEEKQTAKERYFHELINSREAVVCKAIDRYMNLATMMGALKDEAIIKNIIETDRLLLPVLKEAKEKWPELSDIMFILRTNIRSVNEPLAYIYKVELTGDSLSGGASHLA